MNIFTRAANKEPAMMLALGIATVSLLSPLAIVPLRRSMGYKTYQWDADPKTHPLLNMYNEIDVPHKFDDIDRLVAWSKHAPYHYSTFLPAKDYAERDFPEARERIAKGII